MVKPKRIVTVSPAFPEGLERLKDLAYNLWWSWNREVIDLFRRIDNDLWEESDHNPVWMLGKVSQERLEAAAQDQGFLGHLGKVCERFDEYLSAKDSWYKRICGDDGKCPRFAYFSTEFGITECLPIYSGGLGVLAGDHLKSASDLGIPLVGVGLLYQKGYFRQYLNPDGWQQERYPINDFYTLPLQLERGKDGKPLTIAVELPGRWVTAQVWRAQVGRVPLYLLDTNVPENTYPDHDITDELYGGDQEMRIQQEILLGMGGVRALEGLGIRPEIFHINEGHSAFLILERIRQLMKNERLAFKEAGEAVAAGNVFTTHTPVPAGIDRFSTELMDKYFWQFRESVGISREEFLSLGLEKSERGGEWFNMAGMALRSSCFCNGVSILHREVSRRMWKNLWPEFPLEEVPIYSVTNGVHCPSWVSQDLGFLFDRYLGPEWREDPGSRKIWKHAERIPPEELWTCHERRRERLVAYSRQLLSRSLAKRGAAQSEAEAAYEVLLPDALTIGFARRFATYKRATLLLRDTERLSRILNNKDRPVQIIFSGKAHPKDDGGKELIRQIIHLARKEEFRRRIVFLENYSMSVVRYLVQGADLWLNTPRRFMEASGTSGMKAAMNGVLNMSILDGWWDEGFRTDVGWAIGSGEVYDDHDYQDWVESRAIYDLLEKEVVPAFYDRGKDGLPRKWIEKMKSAIGTLCPAFNSHRMVSEYAERFYLRGMDRSRRMKEDGFKRVRNLAAWKARMERLWKKVQVQDVRSPSTGDLKAGNPLEVEARVFLGELSPQEVAVELFHGALSAREEIEGGGVGAMNLREPLGEGHFLYQVSVPCRTSGRYGFTVRIRPQNEDLCGPAEMNLIRWA